MTQTNMEAETCQAIIGALKQAGIDAEFCATNGPRGDHWPRRFKESSQADEASKAVVCYPQDASAVATVFAEARKHGIKIAAFGLGSSVVGCFDGSPGIYCSTERMTDIEAFDPTDCRVTVGAGVNGGDLQQYLLKRGFELGQTPQSLYMSTVGGWVNTRAAGGLSTLYGGIEDVVTGIEAVLPTGEIVSINSSPRPSGGLDPIRTLIGTEGSLAIVTKVTLAVFRQLPTVQMAAGFNDFSGAIEAQRQLVQGGFPVALLRSYNIAETAHVVAPGQEPFALLNFTMSAPAQALGPLQSAAEQIIRQCGGWLLNEDVAANWYVRRYQVETMMEDRNSETGKMFDTVELSLPWSTAARCVEVLEEKVGKRTTEFFAHFSHAYQTGACLYAIFWVENETDEAVLADWAQIWEDVIATVAEHGGTLSHHHGIGAVRAKRYQNSDQGRLHARLKSAVDPENTLFARLLE
ncbi:FAD-binding oxidoreductase [Paracoccaceae bacterium GXU_MW_L88]